MGTAFRISRRRFLVTGAASMASLTVMGGLPLVVAGAGEARFAYVGTYTTNPPGGGGTLPAVGISVFHVTADALTLVQTVPSANPSFLAVHPTQRFLYATNEIDDYSGQKTGSVEAYAINQATGMLTLLNRQSTGGPIPAHLAVAPDGRNLVIANYVGGNFVALPLAVDGTVGPVTNTIQHTGTGPNKDRQEAPHPHCVAFDPAGRYIASADLGIDTVQIFRLDTAGKLVVVGEAKTAPGAGPRHLAFSPDSRFLYVVSELNATITVFPYDAATGALGQAIQALSTVPANFVGTKSTAEIVVHPSGKFLYNSNRGQPDATTPEANAIVGYTIDGTTGKLTLIEYTTAGIKYPRNFAIDPTGTWLYACNQQADTIVQFRIDATTGRLTATGRMTSTPTPVALVFASPATAAAPSPAPMPGLPDTGGGGMAGDGHAFGLLGAIGLGAAAFAALARRAQAPDSITDARAETPGRPPS
jgi:6-phosphogluconolactonase